jgi:uncharacterized membrane protein
LGLTLGNSRIRTASILLCVAGLAVSGYLTVVHITQGGVPLACPASGTVNCERVVTSPQSTIGPVPVPVLGMLWFGILGASLLAPGFRDARFLRVAWVLGGLGFVLYLVYAELFLIGAICLWCTVVHALVFVICLLVFAETFSG